MKFNIKWGNLDIVTISRENGVYIANIDNKCFNQATKSGMPVSILAELKAISDKLPPFVMERIPSKELRDKTILKSKGQLSDDEGDNILDYIDITNCRQKTDKFSIYVQREKDKFILEEEDIVIE